MKEKRINELYEDYVNAFARLNEGVNTNIKDDIKIDGVIQRFEFTFELAWKLMKMYLEHQGLQDCSSPRAAIKTAFESDLVKNGEQWINMMLDRNKSSHIYDEKEAKDIYKRIKNIYLELFKELIDELKLKILNSKH
jgi:nucleotidyltransferase substrate binding protein (TIGR01987 family)